MFRTLTRMFRTLTWWFRTLCMFRTLTRMCFELLRGACVCVFYSIMRSVYSFFHSITRSANAFISLKQIQKFYFTQADPGIHFSIHFEFLFYSVRFLHRPNTIKERLFTQAHPGTFFRFILNFSIKCERGLFFYRAVL